MRRLGWIGVGVVLAVALLAGGVALGQGLIGGRLVRPVRVMMNRSAPVLAEVVVLVDGAPVTASVPLSVHVEMVVDVTGDDAVSALASVGRSVMVSESRELLLDLTQMPTGFYLDGEVAALTSNEGLAESFADEGAALAMLEDVGRLGGFFADYGNAQFSMFGGVNGKLTLSAIVFVSPDGAQRYVAEAMEREALRKEAEIPVEIAAPQIGDGSVLYKVDVVKDDGNVSKYQLFASRGNVAVVVDARALQDVGDIDQMIDLAEKMLVRLE